MTSACLPRLVMVDSSPQNSGLVMSAVRSSGVECELVLPKGELAAAEILFDERQETPTLIVLECKLPGVDPRSMLRELRKNERLRRVPVVILSDRHSGERAEECYRHGANSCIDRPSDPSEFIESMVRLVQYWFRFNRVRPREDGPTPS